jgi:hypothetical protein
LGPKSNVVQTGKIKTVYFSVRRQKETPENAPTQKYETPNIHPLPDAQSRNDADRGAPLTSVAHQPLFYLLPR